MVEAQRDVTTNVFKKAPSGSFALNDFKHMRPEVTVICRAFLLPGNGKRLAGVACRDKVASPFVVKVSEVGDDGHSGPVMSEDGLAEGVDFGEGNGANISTCCGSGPACGECEPADPAAQIDVSDFFIHHAARG